MNCGICALKRYFELIGYDGKTCLDELEGYVDEDGLSFYALMEVLNSHGFITKAYKSWRVYKQTPYLLLDAKGKHYYLVIRFDRYFVYLFDSNFGDFCLIRPFFRLIWFRYYLTIEKISN